MDLYHIFKKIKIVYGTTVTAALSPRPYPSPSAAAGRARRGPPAQLSTGHALPDQLNITPVV